MNIQDISNTPVIWAEDSVPIVQQLSPVLRAAGGLEDIRHVLTLTEAEAEVEKLGKRPAVLILDNVTPPDFGFGFDIGMNYLGRKEEYPHLLVISLFTSDAHIFFDEENDRAGKMEALGGSAWPKHNEGFLGMLHVVDSLKRLANGEQNITRTPWLRSFGIDTNYHDLTNMRLGDDFLLRYAFSHAKETDGIWRLTDGQQMKQGFLLTADTKDFLREIGIQQFSPEGAVKSRERE